MTDINKTLEERGSKYGEFKEHAEIAQMLKNTMYSTRQWTGLPAYIKEALEMIQHKIARVLNGDPLYIDTFTDISGYSQLVTKELLKTNGATDVKMIKMRVIDSVLTEMEK